MMIRLLLRHLVTPSGFWVQVLILPLLVRFLVFLRFHLFLIGILFSPVRLLFKSNIYRLIVFILSFSLFILSGSGTAYIAFFWSFGMFNSSFFQKLSFI